jgi:hypothetical protein
MRIRHSGHPRSKPIRLMPKHHANRKTRLPIEQIHRMNARLDSGNFTTGGPQLAQSQPSIPDMLPGHSLLRP